MNARIFKLFVFGVALALIMSTSGAAAGGSKNTLVSRLNKKVEEMVAQNHSPNVQLVGHTIIGHHTQTGVTKNGFAITDSRRIAFVGGL